jgi:hypothetical protein
MSKRRTDDSTLIAALRILARDIECGDGVANATIAEAADRLETLVDGRRDVPLVGEIVEMNYSEEIGVYYGTIQCPTCQQQVEVAPMNNRPRCRCGTEWDFSVSAVGWQPLPPGPEAA